MFFVYAGILVVKHPLKKHQSNVCPLWCSCHTWYPLSYSLSSLAVLSYKAHYLECIFVLASHLARGLIESESVACASSTLGPFCFIIRPLCLMMDGTRVASINVSNLSLLLTTQWWLFSRQSIASTIMDDCLFLVVKLMYRAQCNLATKKLGAD